MKRAAALLLLGACAVSGGEITPVTRAAAKRHAAVANDAAAKKDYAKLLVELRALAADEPEALSLLYNEGAALALLGKPADAVLALARLADRQAWFDLAADEDLATLRDRPDFQALRARMDELHARTIGQAELAFTLPERDQIVEGLAYDPRTHAFFASSVHKKKIVRVIPGEAPVDFVTTDLWSVLALAVDGERGLLWACTAGLPQMDGYTHADDGYSALVAYDLTTGAPRRRLDLPAGSPHALNDLAIAADGTVYASDSLGGGIYAARPGQTLLARIVPEDRLRSPQGMVLRDHDRTLLVADYATGLYRVELATHRVTHVPGPAGVHPTLAGIDALVAGPSPNVLYAVQNGIQPPRVTRLELADDRVAAITAVLMNDRRMTEPTLAVRVDGALYFVANSQWASFSDDGKIWPLDRLQPTMILRLAL